MSAYDLAISLAPKRLLPVLRDSDYSKRSLVLETVDWLDTNGFSTLADDLTEEASL